MVRAVKVVLGLLLLLLFLHPQSDRIDGLCSALPPPTGVLISGDPLWLVASATQVRPGEEITMRVEGAPVAVTRGIDAYLECWAGSEWAPRYIMLVDRSGMPTVRAYPLPPNHTIPDIGLNGRGLERIKIPVEIEPRVYRIRKQVSATSYGLQTLYLHIQVVP